MVMHFEGEQNPQNLLQGCIPLRILDSTPVRENNMGV